MSRCSRARCMYSSKSGDPQIFTYSNMTARAYLSGTELIHADDVLSSGPDVVPPINMSTSQKLISSIDLILPLVILTSLSKPSRSPQLFRSFKPCLLSIYH